MKQNGGKKRTWIWIAAAAAVVCVLLGIWLLPKLRGVSAEELLLRLEDWIASYGDIGFLVLLGVQIVQIVIAIIPGGPVQIAAGVLFGTWGGLLLCFLGTLIGSIIVFCLVRRFGRPLVIRMVGQEQFEKVKFLQNAKRLDLLVLIFYLIPGMPKDALTYVAALTPIDPLHFFVISTLARIPAQVTSIWAGSSIVEGRLLVFVILIAVIVLFGVIGILFHDQILARLRRK